MWEPHLVRTNKGGEGDIQHKTAGQCCNVTVYCKTYSPPLWRFQEEPHDTDVHLPPFMRNLFNQISRTLEVEEWYPSVCFQILKLEWRSILGVVFWGSVRATVDNQTKIDLHPVRPHVEIWYKAVQSTSLHVLETDGSANHGVISFSLAIHLQPTWWWQKSTSIPVEIFPYNSILTAWYKMLLWRRTHDCSLEDNQQSTLIACL